MSVNVFKESICLSRRFRHDCLAVVVTVVDAFLQVHQHGAPSTVSEILEGSTMSRDRLDINIGCGKTILSFFIGLAALIVAVGLVLYLLLFS